jgi:hypothetical protein
MFRLLGPQKGVKNFSYNFPRLKLPEIGTIYKSQTTVHVLSLIVYTAELRNSPYCQCGYGKETVEHYLLECREYRDQRGKLRK